MDGQSSAVEHGCESVRPFKEQVNIGNRAAATDRGAFLFGAFFLGKQEKDTRPERAKPF